jgi:hypothetical protein
MNHRRRRPATSCCCATTAPIERLSRWIATAGHEVVVLSGKEVLLNGDDPRVNLVVTDLDSDDPAVRC